MNASPDSAADAAPGPAPEHLFEAQLELDSEQGGVLVALPENVSAALETRDRVAVVITFDGFPHQGTAVPLTDGRHGVLVPKAIRGAIGKTWGDFVTVVLSRDRAPRVIEVPEDFAHALATTPGARARFYELSYDHQREFVRWLAGAKKVDVRRHRIAEAVELVAAGKKRNQGA